MLKMGKVDSKVGTRIRVSLWIASAILSPRNDDVKVDSRDNAQSLNNSAQDSRIFGENLFCNQVDRRKDLGDRIGVFRVAQGDKTRGLSTQRATNSRKRRKKTESKKE